MNKERWKIFEKILLLLDGSELAEGAAPYVLNLAIQLGADIYLLHICPPEHRAYRHMHQIYLDSIAENLRQNIKDSRSSQKPKIQIDVIEGDPIKVIFDYVKQKSIDMVALTSHGNSGILAWAMGGVADKVVWGVGIPTLLIRSKRGRSALEDKGLI